MRSLAALLLMVIIPNAAAFGQADPCRGGGYSEEKVISLVCENEACEKLYSVDHQGTKTLLSSEVSNWLKQQYGSVISESEKTVRIKQRIIRTRC